VILVGTLLGCIVGSWAVPPAFQWAEWSASCFLLTYVYAKMTKPRGLIDPKH
jgi:hypothetical protein